MAEGIKFVISAVDDFSQTMSDLQSKSQQAVDAIGGIGKAVTGMGLAISAGLGFAVKTSMDFESQLSRVGAIAGASASELDALRESALELGASTSKSASEVAIAQEGLAALGMTVDEILGAMPGVISAAEASGSDMAQTAEVMASTLNIFGMEASKASYVADVLAQTANQSAADLTDMQYALKYAGPPAAALGVSLEELSASIGIMTNAGMGGEQAGTTMRAALLSLLNPSEKNAKLMNSLGVAVTDASGNFVGLAPLIENLQTSMEGMTDTQKAANLASLVGTEAVSGMLSLMNAGPAEIEKMSEALRNSGGASEEAATKMKDNLKGAVEELSGAFETLMITIGTALTPVIKTVISAVQWLLDKFNAMPQGVQTALALLTGFIAVLMLLVGPLLIIIAMIPSLTLGFGAIATALGVTSGALAVTIGWIALIVAAVIGIGIALVVAYTKIEWFREMVNTAWEAIKTAFSVALEFIKGVVNSVLSAVSSFIGSKLNEIKAFWDENGATIVKLVKGAFKEVEIIIAVVMGVIQTIFQTVWPIISGIVQFAWALIQTYVGTAITAVLGIIQTIMKLIQGDWEGAWNTIKETASTIMDNIVSYFEAIDLVQIGKDIIQGLIDGIGSMAKNVGKKVQELASMIPDGIKKLLGIHSPSKVTFALGEFTGEGLSLGIDSMVRDIQTASKGMAIAAVPEIPNSRSYAPDIERQRNADKAMNISIAPAPVVIDKRTLGEVVFEVIDEMTRRNEIRSRRFGGEPLV